MFSPECAVWLGLRRRLPSRFCLFSIGVKPISIKSGDTKKPALGRFSWAFYAFQWPGLVVVLDRVEDFSIQVARGFQRNRVRWLFLIHISKDNQLQISVLSNEQE